MGNVTRKPVHLEAQGPKGDRQSMWEAIRKLHKSGEPITVRRVWEMGAEWGPRGRVRDYIVGLSAAGYLRELSREPGKTVGYELANDCGVDAPRVRKDGSEVTQGRGREQMWRTVKIIGEFTSRELAQAASTPAHEVAELTAKDYCLMLAGAGYLTITRQGSPGVPARYRLVPSRWTGPRAPMIQRLKQLYDPNTGEVVYRRHAIAEGGE
ncbi:MAG: hypothetical protein LAT63_17045 [Marinobacter sp.]|nr:hypothetical protein [Marinobacter sp.]